METFFGVVMHLVVITGIAGQFWVIIRIVRAAVDDIDLALRATAVATGFLIFFGARALDIPITDLMLPPATVTSPVNLGIFSILLPSCAGWLLAFYFTRRLRSGDKGGVALRIMLLVGALTVFQFGEAYLAAIKIGGVSVNKAMLPNLSFNIAIGLYATLKYRHKAEELPAGPGGPPIFMPPLARFIRGLLRRNR